MVTEDLKRLRKALDELDRLWEGDEDITPAMRAELDKASDACDDITADIRRIESDISAINRML